MSYEESSRMAAVPRTTQPMHSLTLENRRRMTVSGVEDVESFDEHEIVMLTAEGTLVLRGEELSISKLSVDHGDVCVQGLISGLQYEDTAPARSWWARLFR